jgi:organic hydroperoxide reductase OsmC/OhrA
MASAQELPHHYLVLAHGTPAGPVQVSAQGVAELTTHAPPEFGGPEGFWSPETLFAGAIADCYILSFRAVARVSKLEWQKLSVEVDAILERAEGSLRFTHVVVRPRLVLAAGGSESLARTVLQKAKSSCLVTNSLTATCEVHGTVELAEPAAA